MKLSLGLLRRPELSLDTLETSDCPICTSAHLQIRCGAGLWSDPLPSLPSGLDPNAGSALNNNSSAYTAWIKIEQADFAGVDREIERLRFAAEELDSSQALVLRLEARMRKALKIGDSSRAAAILDEIIPQLDNRMWLFNSAMHAARGRCWMLQRSMKECDLELEKARAIIGKRRFIPAMYGTFYRVVRLAYEVNRFEEAVVHGSLRQRIKAGRTARRAGKAAISCSKKWVLDSVEVNRLVGTWLWLAGRKGRAIRYWKESMRLGVHLGARLELSRTWMEIGRRLREKKSPLKTIDGIAADQYLAKARTFFEEKNLGWDLENLRALTSPAGSGKRTQILG
jgi:hypothetical protein